MSIKKKIYAWYVVAGFCLLISSRSSIVAKNEDEKSILVKGGMSFGDRIVTGKACVIPAGTGRKLMHKIEQGDIVVAKMTNSSWDPALLRAGGIITDEGGRNSHAVLLGMRLSIPVIVGVGDATTKIVDGDIITLDCINKVVYQVAKKENCEIQTATVSHNNFHDTSKVHGVLKPQGKLLGRYTTEKNDYFYMDTIGENKTEAIVCNQTGIQITKQRLQQDSQQIRKYVVDVIGRDIQKARLAGKFLATTLGGISGYVYDSIPFAFFKDQKAIEKVFERLVDDSSIAYICELKETFKREILRGKKEFNETELAEFLYGHVIEKIHVADHHKVILKRQPTKMDEFVVGKEKVVEKDEYMYFTFLNFVTRYYLEQELTKKK